MSTWCQSFRVLGSDSINIVESATHSTYLGIIRAADALGINFIINNKLQTAMKPLYALLVAGLHLVNGLASNKAVAHHYCI